jgi:DNA-binding CsgD family transcriptional regulator
MGTAKSLPQREQMISLYAKGVSMLQISQQEGINYGTVKNLIKRYKNEGQKSLIPRYSQCGLTRPYDSECSYRLVRLYKHYHPKWGVSYILLKIKDKYPQLPLCGSRVYERRLKSENKVPLPKNPPLQLHYHPEGSRLPHDTWQIDAKERLETLDGKAACYLTTTDEKTGCVLDAKVFPLWAY